MPRVGSRGMTTLGPEPGSRQEKEYNDAVAAKEKAIQRRLAEKKASKDNV